MSSSLSKFGDLLVPLGCSSLMSQEQMATNSRDLCVILSINHLPGVKVGALIQIQQLEIKVLPLRAIVRKDNRG